MNRRNFVKILSAATACTIIPAPVIEALATPVKPMLDFSIVPAGGVHKIADWIVVSKEMLDDPLCLAAVLREKGLKLSEGDLDWESKTTIQISENGDDFIRSAKTIVLHTLSKVHLQRIK